MVDSGNTRSGVERRGIDFIVKKCASELIAARINAIVKAFDCRQEIIYVNADLRGKFFQRVTLKRAALRDQIVDRFVEIISGVPRLIAVTVNNDVHIGVCLLKESLCHNVAASAIVDKAVTFLINEETVINTLFNVSGQWSLMQGT